MKRGRGGWKRRKAGKKERERGIWKEGRKAGSATKVTFVVLSAKGRGGVIGMCG